MKLKIDGYFAGDNFAKPIREALVSLTQSIDDLSWTALYRGVTASYYHNERSACEAVLTAYYETQVNVTTMRNAGVVIVADKPKSNNRTVEPGRTAVDLVPVVTVTTKLAERTPSRGHVVSTARQGRRAKPIVTSMAKPRPEPDQHLELCFGETRQQMDEMFLDIRKHAGNGRLTLACADGVDRRIVTCGLPVRYPLVDDLGLTRNRWMALETKAYCGVECEWALWVTCTDL